ncbi:MAG: electron transfer flavoprotein subunit alpha [Candidatus Latescibacterota bacterium]
MENVLFLSHTEAEGRLGKAGLEALQAAVLLAGGSAPLTVGLVGGQVQPAADQIATCGAGAFLAAQGPELSVSRYASDVAAAVALVRAAQATVVVAPATWRLCRALPGAAQRTGGRIDTQVTALQVGEAPKVQRWYYRQRMVATLSRQQRPWFVLMAAGAQEPWQGQPGSATLTAVPVELPALRTRVEGIEAASGGAQTIRPDAQLLFVAGAGWTKKQPDGQTHVQEAEALIRTFLDRTQASLGSSKSLVDQGTEGQEVLSFLSHLNQVGQTGATPRHPKGLSACCHGEEPHVVGWRFINERRAINLDPNCGWARGKADVVYVADAFAVLRRVNEILAAGG